RRARAARRRARVGRGRGSADARRRAPHAPRSGRPRARPRRVRRQANGARQSRRLPRGHGARGGNPLREGAQSRQANATPGSARMNSTPAKVPTDAELESLARRLGEALAARGWTAATAESCTGGWISKAITDIAGSSRWFGAGYVVYSNDAKTKTLGVPAELIAEAGAVSEPVVTALAEAARERAGADIAVAVSGIAGPGGGTPEKPVGTVWFAWAGPHGTVTERQQFDGDREAVRRQTVALALEGLIDAAEWRTPRGRGAAGLRSNPGDRMNEIESVQIGPEEPEREAGLRRIFFALWPDDATRGAIERACRQAVRRSGGRPTAKRNLHLTVAFLG